MSNLFNTTYKVDINSDKASTCSIDVSFFLSSSSPCMFGNMSKLMYVISSTYRQHNCTHLFYLFIYIVGCYVVLCAFRTWSITFSVDLPVDNLQLQLNYMHKYTIYHSVDIPNIYVTLPVPVPVITMIWQCFPLTGTLQLTQPRSFVSSNIQQKKYSVEIK